MRGGGRRIVAVAVAALALLALSACGGGDTADAPVGPRTVELRDIAFKPKKLAVKVGEEVTWKWEDPGIPHNVVAEDDSFKSDLKDSGTFRHTFERRGSYAYTCTVHPGMKASIEVR